MSSTLTNNKIISLETILNKHFAREVRNSQ